MTDEHEMAERGGTAVTDAPALWQPVDPALMRRGIRIVVVTFGGLALLSVIGAFVVAPDHGDDRASPLLLGAQATLLGTGFAAALALWRPLNRALRDLAGTGGDPGWLPRYAKAAFPDRDLAVGPDEQRALARYAAAYPRAAAAQMTYFLCLVASFAVQALDEGSGGHPVLGAVLLVAFVLAVAVALPSELVRVRRARGYARRHPALLRDGDSGADSGADTGPDTGPDTTWRDVTGWPAP